MLIGGTPEPGVSAQFVSGGYFSGLGVRAFRGRTLTEEDDRPEAEAVMVLSHRYWQDRFNADLSVLGRSITINQVPVTIVGVTPPGFNGALQVGDSPAIAVPLAHQMRFQPAQAEKKEPWFWHLRIMGRLRSGTTAAQARANLEPIFQQSAREGWEVGRKIRQSSGPETMPDLPTLLADPGAQGENDTRVKYARSLHVLMSLAGLLLFAACANVANLLLARGAVRRREIAIRLALGASRARIVRQLGVEALLLGMLGAGLGLLLAGWSRGLLIALRPFGNAVLAIDLPLDLRVVGFTATSAFATALLFGLVPALRATRLNLTSEFQGGPRTPGAGGRSRLSRMLMVVQIAVSLVLLVSTGLFIRTLRNLQNVDPGFNARHLAYFRIQATSAGNQREQWTTLTSQLRERLERVAGISAVTYSDVPLLDRARAQRGVKIEGQTGSAAGTIAIDSNAVAPNFFTAMGIPLVLGRSFTERDQAAAPKVAIVNQSFARKFFGTENPIGRRLGWGRTAANYEIEIVGLVGDSKYVGLRGENAPTFYEPIAQQSGGGTANFVVRLSGEPSVVFPLLRAAVRQLDPALPVLDLRRHEEQVERLNAEELLFARLSGFFGLLALALACVGLHGLMAFTVLHRTAEIGLRMALGALPGNVLRMILRESLGLVGAGIVLGIVAAWGAGRLVAGMLFGVAAVDGLTYGTAALVLTAVALGAALLPARRAARIDPMTALRTD